MIDLIKKYLFLLSLILASCTEKQKPLLDKWVEVGNFNDPFTIEFYEDYYTTNLPYNQKEQIYKIKKDTLLFSGYPISKIRYKINNDTLRFIYPESDSIPEGIFIRNEHKNIAHFFNQQLGISIELPEIKGEERHIRSNSIIFFCAYDSNGRFLIYNNGNTYEISSHSFLELFVKKPNSYHEFPKAFIYCSREIRLEDFNQLRIELEKAHILDVNLVTQYNNELGSINTRPPATHYDIVDSSINNRNLDLIPPPPPPFIPENRNKHSILCKVTKESFNIDNQEISFQSLTEKIQDKFHHKKFVLYIHFDESLTYEHYLKTLIKIQNIFYSARNILSIEKYNEPDYNNLDHDKHSAIMKTFPIRIHEVYKAEYDFLKQLPIQ